MSERRRDVLVLVALWLMVLASSSQVMILAPILPRIVETLDVSAERQGLLVSGYALSLSVFAIVIGPISDRVGRRRVLLWGTGAMTVALALHAFATTFALLLTVRIAAGFAGGLLTGSAISYVGDYFPYERRGWASGWVMSGFAAGQIAGIPIGTVLADRYGFASPFLLFMVLMALSFVLIKTKVPQPLVEGRGDRLTLASALRGYGQLLRNRQVLGASLAYATMFFAVSNFLVFFPTWAEQELGMTATGVALLFTIGGVGSVVVGPRAGHWSDRLGRKPLIVGSCLATALLYAFATFVVHERVGAYVLFFASMVLLATRLSPFQALLTALVDARQRGTLMSLVVAIGQLGGGLGGAVAGIAYARAGFFGCSLLAGIAIGVTGLIVATQLPEPSRTPPPEPAAS